MPAILANASRHPRVPSRRCAVQLTSPLTEQKSFTPKKKALLIGINYGMQAPQPPADSSITGATLVRSPGEGGISVSSESSTVTASGSISSDTPANHDGIIRSRSYKDGILYGPHHDVRGMKQLLLEKYGYATGDITVMMDIEKYPLELQPTRENIIRCIKQLVKGAHSGDHLFFHFAGHTTQEDGADPVEEEDGKDEYLCTMDDLRIQDNDLRELLVESLPHGANLTAVFDSCHSATILDLPHTKCNQVYTPWVSKRRESAEVNVSRFVFDEVPEPRTPAIAAAIPEEKSFELRETSTGPLRRPKSLNLLRKPSPSPDSSSTSPTLPLSSTTPYQRSSTRRDLLIKNLGLATDCVENVSPLKECMSPQNLYRCDGWCKSWDPRTTCRGPNVICLSASKDSQLAWESKNGSMTQSLIQMLRENPHPNLQTLLMNLSIGVHKFYLDLHSYGRKRLERWKKKGSRQPFDRDSIEIENFQDPQISSLQPLNLATSQWDP